MDGPHDSRWYAQQPELERLSLYAYDDWQVSSNILLTAGVAYDRLTEPVNFRVPPLAAGVESHSRVSPKAGIVVTPWEGGVLRADYTRSLTGVSLDQSFRLEPVQVAGFNQAFRGLVPEALAGSVAGQEIETWGVAFDQSLPTRTYLTVTAEHLHGEADRSVGAFERDQLVGFISETSLRQQLDFIESSLGVTLGQLVDRDLAVTVSYRLSEADFNQAFPEIPPQRTGQHSAERSVLHTLDLGVRFNHPTGFFAKWDSVWNRQSNQGDAASMAGDNFWQHNAWLGWRFFRRHAELALGVLNVTDRDYHLYPLNLYLETYRARTFAMSARVNF